MNIPGPRPATLAGAFAFSLALHIAVLVWMQPGGRLERVQPEFPLSVTLRQPEPPALQIPPLQPKRAVRFSPAPKTRARPMPAVPSPQPEQPLRLRVVADPATYGAAATTPDRRYAWPGEVDVSPFPPEGISILYPAAALRNEEKGLVVVRIDIDRSGGVEQQQFICSSPGFEQAVREALAAARFRPAFVRETRVPSWILLEFAFLADSTESKDPATPERALAALQTRCLEERRASAQPAR